MTDRRAEYVYDSLRGLLIDPMPGIEDAFADGTPCQRHYDEMCAARERLCLRLGVTGEDKDLETIILSLEHIQTELCIKMYRYGAICGQGRDSDFSEKYLD